MSTAESARIATLIDQASVLITGGDFKEAAAVLRQATTLDDGNSRVRDAWDRLRDAERSEGNFINLCKTYVQNGTEEVGKQALRSMGKVRLSQDDVATAAHLLLESTGMGLQDQLFEALIGPENGQIYLTILLQHDPAKTFERIWKMGARSVGGLVTVLLRQDIWCSEDVRSKIEIQIFSQLMERLSQRCAIDSETALKAIARLLAADTARLQSTVTMKSLDLILSSLDLQNSVEIRSQATLATAKFLEASGGRGETLLKDFIIKRVSTQRTEDLVLAFSAASRMFPIVPATAASLFLTEGFVENLISLFVLSSNDTLRQAVLELLSAACIEKTCREAVGMKCAGMLEDTLGKSSNDGDTALAALILSKVGVTPSLQHVGQDDLVSQLKCLILKPGDSVRHNTIESLAYCSMQPKVKEELANDESFLIELVQLLGNTRDGSLLFGGLTIFSNLTIYSPQLSPQQRKMIQLKAYANASKPQQTSVDPLEDDAHVTVRCAKVISSRIIPLLLKIANQEHISPTVMGLVSNIILALSKHPNHRGLLIQQGLLDTLLRLSSLEDPDLSYVRQQSAYALARTLISLDPALLFNKRRPVTAAIAPLHFLIAPANPNDSNPSNDLLPTFEALRALTNLASLHDEARALIVQKCWDDVETHLWSQASPIQQAALECICNLCQSETAIAKFAVQGGQGKRRVQLLTALASAEQKGVRKAAGGALACVMVHPEVAKAFLELESGMVSLFEMAGEDVEMQARSCAVLACLVGLEGATEKLAVERVKGVEGFVERLRSLEGIEELRPDIEVVCAAVGDVILG